MIENQIESQFKYFEYLDYLDNYENKEYSKIYKIHKYWARKPWYPINQCIRKYSYERDLVVDLFLGSGVMGLEAICLNRDFIGFDINPIAVFISDNTLNYEFIENDFINELNFIKSKIDKLMYSIYSIDKKCSICQTNLIMDHINIGPKFKNKENGVFFCPGCNKRKSRLNITISKEYIDNKYNIDKWIPLAKFPEKFYKDRFSYKGIKKVTDMYTNRNLYALSEILYCINNTNLEYRNLFLLAFTNTLLHSSKLKSENVRPLNVNNYWIPDDFIEENVWLRFLDRVNLIIKSKRIYKERVSSIYKLGNYKLYITSSSNTNLKDESVDYIITDPPYGDVIQYSELAYVWNSWMESIFDTREELIINPKQNKSNKEYIYLLDDIIREGHRILKSNHYFTLCFNNKNFDIWQDILNIFIKNNFNLIDIEVFDTLGNSYNKNWAKFSPKADLYLTFNKSRYEGHLHNIKYSVTELITEILKDNKETNCSKVYDLLIKKLVWELYYNKYKPNLSGLSIKKVNLIIGEILNGN